jgi:hypothetical protein
VGQLCLAVSVGEMFRQVICSSSSLVAEGLQQVLRNVSSLVLKRYNSTVAVVQARPEEWDYAKPFEDIPGPKPLPIIGNMLRFIPYFDNVFCCCRQVSTMITCSKAFYPSVRTFSHFHYRTDFNDICY